MPIAASTPRTTTSRPARRPTRAYRVAGRMAARRGHGGAAFLDLVDRSGKLQVHAKRDVLGEESFDTLVSLDLGDLIGVDGTAFKSRRGELSLLRRPAGRCSPSRCATPPDKFHGLEDVETRYRHRELDLIANEETRELFILRSQGRPRDPPLARRARLPRGRDPDPPAALRRRAGAAVRDAPQRARPRPLPADRRRAVPQAPDRRRARARLRDRQGLPQRGRLAQAQPRVHDARVVRGLRGLRRHRGPARGAGRATWPSEVGYDGPIDFTPPVEAHHAARRDQGEDRHRHLATRDDGAAAARARWAKRRGRRCSRSTSSPKLEQPDLHPRLPDGAVAVREGPPLRAGPRRALRGVRRRAWSSPTRSPS